MFLEERQLLSAALLDAALKKEGESYGATLTKGVWHVIKVGTVQQYHTHKENQVLRDIKGAYLSPYMLFPLNSLIYAIFKF